MKKIDKIFFFTIVLIIIATHLYAYRVWIFSADVLTHGDWFLSFPSYSKSLLSIPIMWKSYSGGVMDLTPPFYVFLLLEGILSNIGISYAHIQRITFMWPIALLTLPFTFLLIRSFTKNPIAALVGATVYTYNTYFLVIQSGHLTMMTAFALAPLFLLLFRTTLDKNKIFYGLLAGLAAFLMSVYEFRAFYMAVAIAGFYYIYYLSIISDRKISKAFGATWKLAIIPILVPIILNLYWILPFIFATSSIGNAVFSRELFGKEFYDIIKSTTIFHPFWNNSKYLPFITQPIPFYFFILPFFAFLGLYLNKRNKYVLFFGLISLLGIFLTKQNNPPFPDIYMWLYTHIPGFAAFREASKFYFLIALGYSVLIGMFVDWIWMNWKNGKLKLTKYIITFLILLLSLWNLKPLITGEYGTLFTPRKIPNEYIVLNDYIDKQHEFFRTLWVPADSRWGAHTNLHPKLAIANTVTSNWKDFTNASAYQALGDQFIDFFKKDNSPMLLDQTSIKYVIVPLDDTKNDDNFFVHFLKPPNNYINSLNKLTYLKRVDINTKQIAVFENKSYRPHIYITASKETIKRPLPYERIEFTTVSQSEYRVQLKNISKPTYLHFTDTYHPDWRIKIGNFNWYASLFNKSYFAPNNFHYKNDVNLNSFLIDPEYIKKHVNKGDYKINSDDSVDTIITLYFSPQSHSQVGLILAILFILFMIHYMVKYVYENYKKQN